METELVTWLRQRLPDHPLLKLGIGDDAAILQLAGQQGCVITSDLLTDSVHFDLESAGPARVGRKALAVNLSDLAAMAARPVGVVVSVALPRAESLEIGIGILEGMLPLAEQFDLAIAGGDTNTWDNPLVISITAFGEVTEHPPLTRGGALPGDQIVVTGSFGGSILGKHLDFEPRVRDAMLMNANYKLHAGIDVSDGLTLDLWRLAQESGCGAVLELESIPVSDAARSLEDLKSPLDHALGDGEDFELIVALPPEESRHLLRDQPLGVPVTRIGSFVPEPGLWQQTEEGRRRPLDPLGFMHRQGL